MGAKYVAQDLTPSDHAMQFIFPTAVPIYSSLFSPRTEPTLLQTARNYLTKPVLLPPATSDAAEGLVQKSWSLSL